MSVYFIYSFYGTRLSYVVSTLDYPFIDSGLESLDAAVGFHWGQWQHFVVEHRLVLLLHNFVYPTHFFQIALCVTVFAYFRPGSRNYEMLFLLTLSVIIAITIFAIYPTLGPAKAVGIWAPHEKIIGLLRLGKGQDLPYTGIISFPSFHTVMAFVFVYCNRGIKQSFFFRLVVEHHHVVYATLWRRSQHRRFGRWRCRCDYFDRYLAPDLLSR